ncbi:metallophosphoesterase [Candidatus Woesearchaeota archaeon]|nr:metallophosphoesterase [Candidatus Woesearchaeota archaeon]
MNIPREAIPIDLGLYIKKQKVLVFSDFHLGYEEALQKQGILVPRFQFKDTVQRLEHIFSVCQKKKWSIKTIVINGDLKHEFGKISNQEWREILRLMDILLQHCKELVIVKGNHDIILDPIVKKRMEKGNVKLQPFYRAGSIVFTHGDILVDTLFDEKELKKIRTIIIGNEHPAVALQERGRVERFKCFLAGKYKDKTLFVLPSFQLLTTGTDVLREEILSPYLKQDLKDFGCWIVADDGNVLDFGMLKNVMKKR